MFVSLLVISAFFSLFAISLLAKHSAFNAVVLSGDQRKLPRAGRARFWRIVSNRSSPDKAPKKIELLPQVAVAAAADVGGEIAEAGCTVV